MAQQRNAWGRGRQCDRGYWLRTQPRMPYAL